MSLNVPGGVRTSGGIGLGGLGGSFGGVPGAAAQGHARSFAGGVGADLHHSDGGPMAHPMAQSTNAKLSSRKGDDLLGGEDGGKVRSSY